MSEEIYRVTYGLDGARLLPFQAAQRLYLAGFREAHLLAEIAATMRAESGWYLKAWHHNVRRDADGGIARDSVGRMTVVSTDLGFIQRNVVHSDPKVISDEEGADLAADLFAANPDLANGQRSAEIAWDLYEQRGFSPWYAHTNGSYVRHLPDAILAVASLLSVQFGLGRDLVVLG